MMGWVRLICGFFINLKYIKYFIVKLIVSRDFLINLRDNILILQYNELEL